MNLMNVDADWAWRPYEPSAEVPWDRGAAAHLMRRSGFGGTMQQLDHAVTQDPQQVVEQRLTAAEPAAFREMMGNLIRAALAGGSVETLAAQWAYRMVATPAPLLEKMTLFWHGHFATAFDKVQDVRLMQQQNDLLRQHALGDFRSLLLQISKDPAMLLYLDSATNRKSHPNENYAREIMELFCLGEGHYSEQDIRELARCFTGWEVKRDRFRFNRYQHDDGIKSVLGTTGNLSGEDGVAIVHDHPSAATFLAGKLVRFFVLDEPQPAEMLLKPLADQLRSDSMQIAPTVARILSSNFFFSDYARGRKVRSPVELGIGFLRSLEGTTDTYQLVKAMDQLGQGLYQPPSVKGWDGGRTWINSSTLLARANLMEQLIHGSKTRFDKQPIEAYLRDQGVTSLAEAIDFVATLQLAVPLSQAARTQIVETCRRAGGSTAVQMRTAIHLLCTLPEFQLS